MLIKDKITQDKKTYHSYLSPSPLLKLVLIRSILNCKVKTKDFIPIPR